MTIQPIGSTSAALYLSATDLKEHGVSGGELTLEQAMELTRAAFTRAGLSLTGSIEIEAFPDLGGVLVFVRLTPPERRWMSFDSLEALLSALPQVPRDAEGLALYQLDGAWWLALPEHARAEAARLSEFGEDASLPPLAEAAFLEHAQPVAAGEQFAHFRECFRV